MLVDVIELRRAGRKLPGEEVQSARTVRGVLRLDEMRGMGLNTRAQERPLIASLMTPEPGKYDELLPPLCFAVVARIRPGAGLIIRGLQDMGDPRRKTSRMVPQAWYARVVKYQEWTPLPPHVVPVRVPEQPDASWPGE
jgi:hypothetical protein